MSDKPSRTPRRVSRENFTGTSSPAVVGRSWLVLLIVYCSFGGWGAGGGACFDGCDGGGGDGSLLGVRGGVVDGDACAEQMVSARPRPPFARPDQPGPFRLSGRRSPPL